MAVEQRNITVLGAGIGGLAVATALARRGARVQVLEQAPALREVGAGIQISPNGMAVLHALGVVDGDPKGAMRSQGTILCDYGDDTSILTQPPPQAGAAWYYHRADLVGLLSRTAQAAGVSLRLGTTVSALKIETDAAVLSLADGTTLTSRCLIAADGIHSVARKVVDGPGAAKFSGHVAWRAVVPWEGREAEPVARVAMGPGRHVVTYPLRGGQAMNLVAVEERRDWTSESWSRRGDPEDLRTRFADFGGRAGRVLRGVDQTYLWALYLHPVATRWHAGPVALLGDAAHPTLPFLAQGACLALEDAWVLAAMLDRADTVEAGFAAYQQLRQERARRVVATARSNGRRFHLKTPMREIAHLVLKLGGTRVTPDLSWLYGYDAKEV